jgi:hypothetical protein
MVRIFVAPGFRAIAVKDQMPKLVCGIHTRPDIRTVFRTQYYDRKVIFSMAHGIELVCFQILVCDHRIFTKFGRRTTCHHGS